MNQDSCRSLINHTLRKHPNSFVNVEDIVKEIRYLTQEGFCDNWYDAQAVPQIMPSYDVPVRRYGFLFKIFAVINKPLKKLPFYETKLLPIATKIRAVWPTKSQGNTPDFYHCFFSIPTDAFLYEAYQFTLHRAPDPEGAAYWMKKLHNNETDRIVVLGTLRFSAEGKAHSTDISKLYVQYCIRKVYYDLQSIPVLGYLIQWLKTLLYLPRLTKTVHALKEDMYQQQLIWEQSEAQKAMIAALERRIEESFNSQKLNMDDKVSSYQLDALKAKVFKDLQDIKNQIYRKLVDTNENSSLQ